MSETTFDKFLTQPDLEFGKASYPDILRTISSLLEIDSAVVAGAFDNLAKQVIPFLQEGDTFDNLKFSLQVFPDEDNECCYFVISCGDYGSFTLKYDPAEFYRPELKKDKRRGLTDTSARPSDKVEIDAEGIEDRLVADAEDAVDASVEAVENGADDEDGTPSTPGTFHLIAIPKAPTSRRSQSLFGADTSED